jgi:hypothetical protein
MVWMNPWRSSGELCGREGKNEMTHVLPFEHFWLNTAWSASCSKLIDAAAFCWDF